MIHTIIAAPIGLIVLHPIETQASIAFSRHLMISSSSSTYSCIYSSTKDNLSYLTRADARRLLAIQELCSCPTEQKITKWCSKSNLLLSLDLKTYHKGLLFRILTLMRHEYQDFTRHLHEYHEISLCFKDISLLEQHNSCIYRFFDTIIHG